MSHPRYVSEEDEAVIFRSSINDLLDIVRDKVNCMAAVVKYKKTRVTLDQVVMYVRAYDLLCNAKRYIEVKRIRSFLKAVESILDITARFYNIVRPTPRQL